MKNRMLRIGIVVWLLLVVVVSWYALSDRPFRTGSTDMPQAADLVAGQQQTGAFYAAEPTEAGATRVALSPRGRVWNSLPAPVPGRLVDIAASPVDGDLIYAATDEGLFVTRDGGADWTRIEMPAPVTAVAMDSQMADLAYVATEGPVIYRMTDLGASRQPVAATGLEGNRVDQLVVNADNNQIVLAVTERGIFRSDSSGESWTPVEGLPRAVSSVVPAPHNALVLYAGTYETGFFRSRDGGQSWQAANVGLGETPGASLAVTALSADPAQDGMLYAATGYVLGHTERVLSPAGIYVSVNGGTDWVQITEFEPGVDVVNTLVPAGDGSVRAVTNDGVQTYSLDVAGAATALDSADNAERLAAAKRLSIAATAEQAETLLAHIDDADPEVGYYVARALGRIDSEYVVGELVQRVETGPPAVRQRAILALGELGASDAVPVLIATFKTEDELATLSAQALVKIGTDQAWDAVIEALADDTYTPQRQAALTALEQRGEPAVPMLIDALADERATMRANAARALGWIDSPQAVQALRPLLDDTSPEVRASAAWALGELGDTTSLSMLDRMAREDANADVRTAAEQAVDRIQADPTLLPEEAFSPPAKPALSLDLTPIKLMWSLLAVTAAGVVVWVVRYHGPRLAA